MPVPVTVTVTVAAAVVIRDGRVLLTQRPESAPHLPLLWEFPGGKIEDGESPPQALAREMLEELGVEASVEAPFAFNWHDDGTKRVLLLCYRARIEGEPRRIGVKDLGWFAREAVARLPMPPADGPILERLLPLLA